MAPSSRPLYSKWYWRDWFADTTDLNNNEYAAYHRLLGYCVQNSPDFCSMPDDDRRLASAAKMGLKGWRAIRSRVLSYFLREGDRWVSNRLRQDAIQWAQHVENQRLRRTGGRSPAPPEVDHRALAREVRDQIEAQPLFGGTASEPPPAIVLALPTNQEGLSFPVSVLDVERWERLYPAVDVAGELRKVEGWLDANPTRRKTPRGMKAFVNRWLAREQDRGPRNVIPLAPVPEGLSNLVEPGYEFGQEDRRTRRARNGNTDQET